MSSLVDITSHKRNEEYRRQSAARRRLYESPTNIPSHELLNPPSATPQCADAILADATLHQARRRRRVPDADETEKPTYRVLIVEDNLTIQKVLQQQLKNEGCITHVVDNGQQALDFVRNSSFGSNTDGAGGSGGSSSSRDCCKPDVVLMDMEMPVMDGCKATSEIRALERSGKLAGHLPIISISANTCPEKVALMIGAGVDDAIPKPFCVAMLLDCFARVMLKLSIAAAPPPRSP